MTPSQMTNCCQWDWVKEVWEGKEMEEEVLKEGKSAYWLFRPSNHKI